MIIDFHSVLSPKYYLYLSFWNLLAVIFHRYTYKYYNLLLSCIIVSIVSFCIAYVSPRFFVIETHNPRDKRTVDGWTLKLGDFVGHHIPLIIVVILYGSYYIKTKIKYGLATITTLLIITLYTAIMNPFKLYNIGPEYICVCFALAIFIYIFLPSR